MAKRKVSKLSKKEQRALNSKNRNLWSVNPVSRVVQSKKVYSRKRIPKAEE